MVKGRKNGIYEKYRRDDDCNFQSVSMSHIK